MNTRIVAFLGPIREYEQRHYARAGEEGVTGNVSALPGAVWFSYADVDGGDGKQRSHLVVIGSRETERHCFDFSDLRRELEIPDEYPIAFVEYQPQELRSASTGNAEFWRLFSILSRVLGGEPLDVDDESVVVKQGDPRVFHQPVERVVLDITHGFRAVAFLSGPVLDFVLALHRIRRRPPDADDRPEIEYHVLYAAFEDVEEDPTSPVPVWDLSRFVEAARWAAAVDGLMSYGRGDDFELLAGLDGKTRVKDAVGRGVSGRDLKTEDAVRKFGRRAKRLADDLALARTKDILSESGPRLGAFLRDQGAVVTTLLPALGPVLARLESWVRPLSQPGRRVFSADGLRAMMHLVELYGGLQRFAEQAAMLREALLTDFALRRGYSCPEPGESGCLQARRSHERLWNAHIDGRDPGPESSSAARAPRVPPKDDALATLSLDAREPRNDIEHCGLNDSPSDAPRLRTRLLKLGIKLRSCVSTEVQSSSFEAPPPDTRGAG